MDAESSDDVARYAATYGAERAGDGFRDDAGVGEHVARVSAAVRLLRGDHVRGISKPLSSGPASGKLSSLRPALPKAMKPTAGAGILSNFGISFAPAAYRRGVRPQEDTHDVNRIPV